jgi:hypothetical protein
LDFFRVFVDPARIRLAAQLLDGPQSLSDLASKTGLDGRAISKHLGRFAESGLLVESGGSGSRLYALDEVRLRSLAESVLTSSQPPLPSDEREKALRTFLPDGRLAQIPSQQRKQLYVLAEIVKQFEPGSTYFESDVNGILKQFTADQFVTLRRMLVDFGFLKRDNAVGGAVYTRGLSTRAIFEVHEMPWNEEE